MDNRKSTWNYILNDIAFISLLTECLYSEYPSSQHKYDLEYQIKLIQDKLNKQKEVLDKIKDICLENMYVDDRGGEPEKVERDIRPSKILELLEEIE